MLGFIESLEVRRLFATNLLANGSFETPQVGVGASGQGYTDYTAGTVLGAAWKVTANSADIVSNKAGTAYTSKAENGNQYVDLAGFAPGTITQSAVTAANHEYELTFSWTATPFAGGPTTRTMNVSFGGKTIASLSKAVTGETPTSPGWQTSTYLVTASSASSAVTFVNTSTGSLGMALDNVSLTAVAFGTGAISGQVFADGNGDGKKGTDAIGLSGWKVYIDLNNNGTLDTSDRVVTTDHLGDFSFNNLGPGTYTVRIVAQTGWKTTTVASFSIAVTTAAISGKLFGEEPI